MNCESILAENRKRADAGERPQPLAPRARPVCGLAGGPGNARGDAAEIAALAELLSATGLDRPVIDRTGLTGRFDIDFRSAPPRAPNATAPSDDLTSVFTAVQEQLGLRLKPATGAVQELVIDRIEMPSDN